MQGGVYNDLVGLVLRTVYHVVECSAVSGRKMTTGTIAAKSFNGTPALSSTLNAILHVVGVRLESSR